jgi:cation diffusion facilitator CzcD-associated flavoprotein CzcO
MDGEGGAQWQAHYPAAQTACAGHWHSVVPIVPNFPGIEKFKGEQQHSSKHPGPDTYAGKKCIVIGSNNSAQLISARRYGRLAPM